MARSSEEKAQDTLIDKLEEHDWDVSEETLDRIAEEMAPLFPNLELAQEFVYMQASALYEMMEDLAQRREEADRKKKQRKFK